MVDNMLDISKISAVDPSQLDEDQLEIYYAVMESVGNFRVGIEQLEQTGISNWQIRELTDLFNQMEDIISQAIPGEGGTASSTILSAIDPVEDYIFQISASLKNIDYYEVQKIHNALDTMYFSLGSLIEMAKMYYPEKGGVQLAPDNTEPEPDEPEINESEQELELTEDEAKNIIDAIIESELPKEDKKELLIIV